jgi:hypothetical protein
MSLRATVLGAVTGLLSSASETGNSLLNAWGTGRGSKILRSNAGKMVREITGAMV